MALPKFGGAAGSILTGLTAVAMLSLQLAYAHGPAEWIQRGGYKNAAGELCCGERDCFAGLFGRVERLKLAQQRVAHRGILVRQTGNPRANRWEFEHPEDQQPAA